MPKHIQWSGDCFGDTIFQAGCAAQRRQDACAGLKRCCTTVNSYLFGLTKSGFGASGGRKYFLSFFQKPLFRRPNSLKILVTVHIFFSPKGFDIITGDETTDIGCSVCRSALKGRYEMQWNISPRWGLGWSDTPNRGFHPRLLYDEPSVLCSDEITENGYKYSN